ncbi:MAG: hypothetical protein J6J60_06350 [Clostridia bacterium]|nr:hypothetical protein [Clostridia bacterium]
MKKIIISMIVILILVSAIVIFLNYDKELSQTDFIELMDSYVEISNVKIELKDDSFKNIIYIKDGKCLTRENDIYTWTDLNTKEYIRYYPEQKIYVIEELDTSGKSFEDSEIISYRFLGYGNYDNTKCAIAEFEFEIEDSLTNEIIKSKSKFWIDSKNGVVLKVETSSIDSDGELVEAVQEYDVYYDVVTDKRVERPALIGYEEYNENGIE